MDLETDAVLPQMPLATQARKACANHQNIRAGRHSSAIAIVIRIPQVKAVNPISCGIPRTIRKLHPTTRIADFRPGAVRVHTETIYSARRDTAVVL